MVDVVALLDGTQKSQVVSIREFGIGHDNVVYDVVLEGNKNVVVKVSPADRSWNQFKQEAWAYARCRAAGVPTPEVYVCDDGLRAFPEVYMIMSRLPGVSGDGVALSRDEKLEISRQLGYYLSLMHGIHPGGFGKLRQRRRGEFSGKHSTYWEFLQRELSHPWWVDVSLNAGLCTAKDVDRLVRYFDEHRTLFELPRGSLVHGDLSLPLKNVLVENGRVSGIIDMEEVSAGDPVKEFAYFDFWTKDSAYLEALKQGYENKALFDDLFALKTTLYQLHMAYYIMVYCHERGGHEMVALLKERIIEVEQRLNEF